MQVGKDAAATRFLSALDTDPVIGSMIDCTSYYEQEQEEYARKVPTSTAPLILPSLGHQLLICMVLINGKFQK